ncbi:MAG: carboxypeptidase regulatory-like domain-containing protein, partial [Acidobacteria bacterium]|nr:carboxypeptidase regulatory-like domain-containing protein [Acidobacteriota bacterium]
MTVCLFLLLAFAVTASYAQSTATGTIVGTVTDASGAVLPEAEVTITNKSTNSSSKTVSNNAGHYIFVNVDPGNYDMRVTKQGFQTAVVQDQVVAVGKSLTEDVKLSVGSVQQEITVETTGTELQTMNATVGNDVRGTLLESLPAVGRDVSTFAVLQPGVSPDGSVAGTQVDQSTFQLDGGQNSSDMDGSQQVYTPSFANDPSGGVVKNQIGAPPTGVMPTPIDSVEEFKVNTANQTADFNSSSGAQVQVVTKRGTNSVHGTVYEYYLDNNFNANTWDNNLSGTPLPSFHYSRFGAALGGPVIPKEILGGKTYLFGNYEGFRWPNSVTQERVVPTAAMEAGILTVNGTQYDLKTLDPRGIGIDPVVQQLWTKFEPKPNDPTCGALLSKYCDTVNTQGFKTNVAIPQKSNFGVVRLDHDFGSRMHFNSSYRYYHLTRATADQ